MAWRFELGVEPRTEFAAYGHIKGPPPSAAQGPRKRNCSARLPPVPGGAGPASGRRIIKPTRALIRLEPAVESGSPWGPSSLHRGGSPTAKISWLPYAARDRQSNRRIAQWEQFNRPWWQRGRCSPSNPHLQTESTWPTRASRDRLTRLRSDERPRLLRRLVRIALRTPAAGSSAAGIDPPRALAPAMGSVIRPASKFGPFTMKPAMNGSTGQRSENCSGVVPNLNDPGRDP